VERLHILVSSPGGSVFHGLSIYNFLKGAPVEVFTYNFGTVDSIGVVIYCAGTRRFCVPHARFLMHGVMTQVPPGLPLDEKDFEEKLKGLMSDYQNIARVISDTTGVPLKKVLEDMNSRVTYDPQAARDYGLVHEISSTLFPAGADLTTIGESLTPAQPQLNMPVFPRGGLRGRPMVPQP
jgi:ATP-dependent Clp protease protease subunit